MSNSNNGINQQEDGVYIFMKEDVVSLQGEGYSEMANDLVDLLEILRMLSREPKCPDVDRASTDRGLYLFDKNGIKVIL